MKLEPTRVECSFELADGETGYEYIVAAVKDPEWGWGATVTLNSHGFKTAEDAVRHLRFAAEHFVKAIADLEVSR